MTWAESVGGVAYLRDADGAEHWRTCPNVPPVADAEAPEGPPELMSLVAFPAPPGQRPTPERIEWIAEHPNAPRFASDELAPDADDELEALGRELDEAEQWREADAGARARLADWPNVRRAVLAMGGIGPSPDWPRDYYPADLYRLNGKPPDIVAAECRVSTIGGRGVIPWASSNDGATPLDDAMFDYLQRSWADWQQLQQERRPRARRTPARAPREALAPPVAPVARVADLRAATSSMARLVADVADLVASGAAPANLARQVADAARTLAEASA